MRTSANRMPWISCSFCGTTFCPVGQELWGQTSSRNGTKIYIFDVTQVQECMKIYNIEIFFSMSLLQAPFTFLPWRNWWPELQSMRCWLPLWLHLFMQNLLYLTANVGIHDFLLRLTLMGCYRWWHGAALRVDCGWTCASLRYFQTGMDRPDNMPSGINLQSLKYRWITLCWYARSLC